MVATIEDILQTPLLISIRISLDGTILVLQAVLISLKARIEVKDNNYYFQTFLFLVDHSS